MRNMLLALWRDERAIVQSMELILIACVAVLALIVGLATYRDALISELSDNGHAINALNQSYSINVADNPGAGISVAGDVVTVTRTYGAVEMTATFNNYAYEDQADFCESCTVRRTNAQGNFEGVVVNPTLR